MIANDDDDNLAPRAASALAEATNPFGNLVSVVEYDGRTTYLYLHHAERREWGMRALWVANHVAAPDTPDDATQSPGKSPRMPRSGTHHPEGHARFQGDELELLWSIEGDGVFLFNRGELLAALVPTNAERACGFARDAIGKSPWAEEITHAIREDLDAQIAEARATWRYWSTDDAWRSVKESRLAHLEAHLGPHAAYFKTTGDRFPPLGMARFTHVSRTDISIYATVGMSALPMPGVARDLANPEPVRRVEIAVATEGEPSWAVPVLAWLARFPWSEYVWVGEQHTILAPTAHATWFPPNQSAILLTASPPSDGAIAAPLLSGLMDRSGDPVTYLWAVPITMDERKVAQLSGSLALLACLPARGRNFVFRE
jgi:hypothetical protein